LLTQGGIELRNGTSAVGGSYIPIQVLKDSVKISGVRILKGYFYYPSSTTAENLIRIENTMGKWIKKIM